jgi:hypothetical protein
MRTKVLVGVDCWDSWERYCIVPCPDPPAIYMHLMRLQASVDQSGTADKTITLCWQEDSRNDVDRERSYTAARLRQLIKCPPRFADEGGLFAIIRFVKPTRRSCTPQFENKTHACVVGFSRLAQPSSYDRLKTPSLLPSTFETTSQKKVLRQPCDSVRTRILQSPHTITVCVETTHKGTVPGCKVALLQLTRIQQRCRT